MRRSVAILVVLLAMQFIPCGCAKSPADELIELLERRSGTIDTISYACTTEDGERLYREEFEIGFPDRYRYWFYADSGGVLSPINFTTQSGTDFYRIRALSASSGEVESLEVETETGIPPLRCTGTYMSLYHLIGNVDYFQSIISLVSGGSLVVSGSEMVNGVDAFLLESAEDLDPRMLIWIDKTTGFPLRKEMALGKERVVVFHYQDFVENQPYAEEPFPPDALPLFSGLGVPANETVKDGACRVIDLADAPEEAGFSPLVPELPGFELATVYVRDPAASTLTEPEGSISFPADFRELYLLLRNGTRQVEIREAPFDAEFSYYTTSMAALSGAYLTMNEFFTEEAGGASYTAAIDCQVMRLVLGDIDLMVTGDLSRAEMEELAIQLRQLSTP
ncbi:MAG: hypothetical protein JW854_00590 [Actinobacteria bacterium]|nr:hypothetical protein [Actinomycetota bacterium]